MLSMRARVTAWCCDGERRRASLAGLSVAWSRGERGDSGGEVRGSTATLRECLHASKAAAALAASGCGGGTEASDIGGAAGSCQLATAGALRGGFVAGCCGRFCCCRFLRWSACCCSCCCCCCCTHCSRFRRTACAYSFALSRRAACDATLVGSALAAFAGAVALAGFVDALGALRRSNASCCSRRPSSWSRLRSACVRSLFRASSARRGGLGCHARGGAAAVGSRRGEGRGRRDEATGWMRPLPSERIARGLGRVPLTDEHRALLALSLHPQLGLLSLLRREGAHRLPIHRQHRLR